MSEHFKPNNERLTKRLSDCISQSKRYPTGPRLSEFSPGSNLNLVTQFISDEFWKFFDSRFDSFKSEMRQALYAEIDYSLANLQQVISSRARQILLRDTEHKSQVHGPDLSHRKSPRLASESFIEGPSHKSIKTPAQNTNVFRSFAFSTNHEEAAKNEKHPPPKNSQILAKELRLQPPKTSSKQYGASVSKIIERVRKLGNPPEKSKLSNNKPARCEGQTRNSNRNNSLAENIAYTDNNLYTSQYSNGCERPSFIFQTEIENLMNIPGSELKNFLASSSNNRHNDSLDSRSILLRSNCAQVNDTNVANSIFTKHANPPEQTTKAFKGITPDLYSLVRTRKEVRSSTEEEPNGLERPSEGQRESIKRCEYELLGTTNSMAESYRSGNSKTNNMFNSKYNDSLRSNVFESSKYEFKDSIGSHVNQLRCNGFEKYLENSEPASSELKRFSQFVFSKVAQNTHRTEPCVLKESDFDHQTEFKVEAPEKESKVFDPAALKRNQKRKSIKEDYEVKESMSKIGGVIFTFERKNQSISEEESLHDNEYSLMV